MKFVVTTTSLISLLALKMVKLIIKLNVGNVDPVVNSIKAELPTGATTSKNSNLVSFTKNYLGNSITLSSTNEENFNAIKSKVPSITTVVAS